MQCITEMTNPTSIQGAGMLTQRAPHPRIADDSAQGVRNAAGSQFPVPAMMKSNWQQVLLVYGGWLVLFALALVLVFLLQRNVVEDILIGRMVNPWRLRSIGQWSVYVLGIGWIVFVFLIEGYLRNGAARGLFWQRIVRVGAPLLALISLSYAVNRFF